MFTNCQGQGLEVFLKRVLPKWDIKCFPHLATFFREFTDEFLAQEHWKADIVFFHHKHDGELDYPTKHPKIPLSVWFQSAPFMAQVPQPIWDRLKEEKADVEYVVKEADLDYQARWDGCLDRMKEKEENELVPQQIRISDLMSDGKQKKLQLTCNHPTTFVFINWTIRIINYLGVKVTSDDIARLGSGSDNPNIAGLPCEESATSGARKHLGLKWGGRPEDDESGRLIARKQLGL